ncbi:hypothetical protein [Gimesia maris]|uniref:hypothetical protein n=1 Tax=Gimesia maris TaxID=122 RepID=UPI0032EF39BE
MSEVECPYCEHVQEVDYDIGNEDGAIDEMECGKCEKTFIFTTSISVDYEPQKAGCLNDEAEHQWYSTCTYPKEFTDMCCRVCNRRRKPTEEEMVEIMGESDGE